MYRLSTTSENTFEARVKVVEPMGFDTFLTLTMPEEDGVEFTARVSPESQTRPDETVHLAANLRKLHLFDDTSGENIAH